MFFETFSNLKKIFTKNIRICRNVGGGTRIVQPISQKWMFFLCPWQNNHLTKVRKFTQLVPDDLLLKILKIHCCELGVDSFFFSLNVLTARVSEDSFTEDSQKFKLCWKLYNVNIRLFCYYDFFILCHVAEIWPKMSN